MQLVKYNLRGMTDEVATMKRQSSIRDNAALVLEERLAEIASR